MHRIINTYLTFEIRARIHNSRFSVASAAVFFIIFVRFVFTPMLPPLYTFLLLFHVIIFYSDFVVGWYTSEILRWKFVALEHTRSVVSNEKLQLATFFLLFESILYCYSFFLALNIVIIATMRSSSPVVSDRLKSKRCFS